MSTEQVVVLFTDLVDSTVLSTSRSPDAADQFRRRHFAMLRRAIAATGGTEAKSLGDGVMVIFDSASSALSCAVQMQQGVAADNSRNSSNVGMRVGVSGGEVAHDGDDYFGDPVVEAARLCATCTGGQIFASEVVRLIAGRRSEHELRPLGPLTLKGLPEPVSTVEVLWSPLEEEPGAVEIPLPERLEQRPGTSFAGRLDVVAAIEDRWTIESRPLSPQIVLLAGEAGLGKTTLAAHVARRAFAEGACTLFGFCEQELSAPYQLFARVLEHCVRYVDDDLLASHVAEHGSALVRLAPSLARRVSELPATVATDQDSERYLLFAATVGLLEEISKRSRVLIVLDDVQWADDGSLALLRYLGSSDRPLDVQIIATCRDNEIDASPGLVEAIGALHRQHCLTRIDLSGLTVADVLTMMSTSGYVIDDVAQQLAANLLRETDGNPFFVLELLRHFAENGMAVSGTVGLRVSSAAVDSTSMPSSLSDVIGARLARLGAVANRVLSVAAVVGREFTVDLVAATSEQPVATVLDVFDDAASASLIRESDSVPGRFGFTHALIQHVLYERTALTRRSLMHRAVALEVEARAGEYNELYALELARHWSNTGQTEDLPRAIRYTCLAGNVALKELAPADALRHFREAAEMQSRATAIDPELEVEAAIGLGTAERQTGTPSYRETLLNAARLASKINDTPRLVRAVLANSRGWYSESGKVDWDKVAQLELALERVEPNTVEHALLLATLCSELTFNDRLDQRLALAEQSLEIARRLEHESTTVRILNLLVFPHLVPPLLDRSLEWSAEALQRAENVRDPLLWFSAALYRATVATRAGDVDEVDRCLAVASELVAQLNQPSLNWEFTFHQAKRAQIAGDLAAAESLATSALSIGSECGEPDAVTFYGVQYAVVAWQNGSMGDLAPIIEQMIADNPNLPTIRASLGMALAEAEAFDACRNVLSEFAQSNFELRMDTAWINGMTEYAEAAINLGDREFAAPLYERLLPWSEQFSSAGGLTAEGPVSYVLGALAMVLGQYDDAAAHLDAALAFCERCHARFFEARTLYKLGELITLRSEGRSHARARELLERARSLSEARGYHGVARRSEQLLATLS